MLVGGAASCAGDVVFVARPAACGVAFFPPAAAAAGSGAADASGAVFTPAAGLNQTDLTNLGVVVFDEGGGWAARRALRAAAAMMSAAMGGDVTPTRNLFSPRHREMGK